MRNSSFAFWNFQEIFPEYFQLSLVESLHAEPADAEQRLHLREI